jgi:hypothetical protein
MENENRERRLSTADIAGSAERREDKRLNKAETEADRRSDGVIPLGQSETIDAGTGESMPSAGNGHEEPIILFAPEAVQDYRSRWTSLQTSFVDEPRRAVQQADELVAEVIKSLASTFSDERGKLEGQWDQGDKVSTEDLRLVLRRYRAFFDRFLSL